MIKTTNREAGRYVEDKKDFVGSNTFGNNINGKFVVYSYGHHFPIYLYDFNENQWYGNEDKYSMTTSKHMTQLHPNRDVEYVNTLELKSKINEKI
jgi:hypothetical protein